MVTAPTQGSIPRTTLDDLRDIAFDDPDGLEAEEFALFTSRPELTQLWELAILRSVSPHGLLGNVLLRVLGGISPRVLIPPYVGSPASLNLAAIVLGPSSAGKSVSADIASSEVRIIPTMERGSGSCSELAPPPPGGGRIDLFAQPTGGKERERSPHPELMEKSNPSTGEAIAKCYLPSMQVKNGEAVEVPGPDRLLFTTDEGEKLEKFASRQGNTLTDTITSAMTGGDIGNLTSSKDTTRIVPARSYRAVISVCIQPALTGWIFAKAASGFPQRFFWVEALGNIDEDAPEEDLSAVAERAPIEIRLCSELTLHKDLPEGRGWHKMADRVEIPFPPAVVRELRRSRRRASQGLVGELDGHRNLTQMKLAVAFAAMAARMEVSEEDWELAELLMKHSDRVRASCQATIAEAETAEKTKKMRADDQAQAVREAERTAEAKTQLIERIKAAGSTGLPAKGTGSALQKLSGKRPRGGGDALRELATEQLPEMLTSREVILTAGGYLVHPDHLGTYGGGPAQTVLVVLHELDSCLYTQHLDLGQLAEAAGVSEAAAEKAIRAIVAHVDGAVALIPEGA